MKLGRPLAPEVAEGLAIQALTFIAGDGDRLGRFLAETGIGPTEIRTAAREPGFLAGVLAFVANDAGLAETFIAETGVTAADIARAREALGDRPWERELP